MGWAILYNYAFIIITNVPEKRNSSEIDPPTYFLQDCNFISLLLDMSVGFCLAFII